MIWCRACQPSWAWIVRRVVVSSTGTARPTIGSAQLEAINQLRATLDWAETFILLGLRIGTPDVADDVIADALGPSLEEGCERIAEAHRLAAELRPPHSFRARPTRHFHGR